MSSRNTGFICAIAGAATIGLFRKLLHMRTWVSIDRFDIRVIHAVRMLSQTMGSGTNRG